jgi:hypothetical protein
MSPQRRNSLSRKSDPAGARTQDLRIKRSVVNPVACAPVTTCDGDNARPCGSVSPGAPRRSARVVSPRCHRPLWLGIPTPKDAA